MNIIAYDKMWDDVAPAIETKLSEIVSSLREKAPTFSVEGPLKDEGDEENSMMALISDASGSPAINISIKLADATAYGEASEGYAIRYEAMSAASELLGSYTPGNYSDGAFTLSSDELLDRVTGLDVEQVVGELLAHLGDPTAVQSRKRTPRP